MNDTNLNEIQNELTSKLTSDQNIHGVTPQCASPIPLVQHSANANNGPVAPSARSFADDEDHIYYTSLELEAQNRFSEPDDSFDYEDTAREHELLMHDLAEDNDDFARSDDEGWYYSDEN